MQVETLGDVLDWTKAAHRNLADCLAHCAEGSRQERVRMLMDYLAEHERELSRTLQLAKQDAKPSALHTWCYEYFDKYPIEPHETCHGDFRDKDTDQVMAAVLAWHEKIIGLYRYLLSRAEVNSTRDLLTNLISLEEHETMRMVRDAGRMQDL